jgi:hypothetical protein
MTKTQEKAIRAIMNEEPRFGPAGELEDTTAKTFGYHRSLVALRRKGIVTRRYTNTAILWVLA